MKDSLKKRRRIAGGTDEPRQDEQGAGYKAKGSGYVVRPAGGFGRRGNSEKRIMFRGEPQAAQDWTGTIQPATNKKLKLPAFA